MKTDIATGSIGKPRIFANSYAAFGAIALLSGSLCSCAEDTGPRIESSPPTLIDNGDLGYYCSMTWPTHGWSLVYGSGYETNRCSDAVGARRVHSGAYLINGSNRVDAWCDTNANHTTYTSSSWDGNGSAPLESASNWASTLSGAYGDCVFRVSMGGPRTSKPPAAAPSGGSPSPAPTYVANYDAFDDTVFKDFMNAHLMGYTPKPVGYQFAVYDRNGVLVGAPYAAGSTQLPSTSMQATRRMDIASLSKTITAMATVAAIQDIHDGILANGSGTHHESNAWENNITLDSYISDFLPNNWTRHSTINNITFRSLLNHTSGLCAANDAGPAGVESYANLRALIQHGVYGTPGQYGYCNNAYGLLRILIPYLVDGPEGYNGLLGCGDAVMGDYTAAAYRNYVRGRILSRIGLTGVDAHWTGTDPLSNVYFWNGSTYVVGCNGVNAWTPGCDIPAQGKYGFSDDSTYRVQLAGSGSWYLSTPEYGTLLSKFWNDEIVFHDTTINVSLMLGLFGFNYLGNSGRRQSGLGFDARNIAYYYDNDPTKWYYTKNGGGNALSVWVTLFNKYSAVFSTNTEWNWPKGWDMETLVGKAMIKAARPTTWTCNAALYGNNTCDTNCGAFDPDCSCTNCF